MDAVARAAGCSREALTAHFRSKAQLFAAVLDREEHRIVQDLAEVAAVPEGEVAGAIAGALERVLVSVTVLHSSWRLLFLADHGSFDDGWRRPARVRSALHQRLTAIVAATIAADGADPAPGGVASTLGFLLTALVEASVRPIVLEHSRPPVIQVAETIDRLLRGLPRSQS